MPNHDCSCSLFLVHASRLAFNVKDLLQHKETQALYLLTEYRKLQAA